MMQQFQLDFVSSTETSEAPGIAQLLRAIAAEHACAMRAAGKAERPRQCLAELRAWYCPKAPDRGVGWRRGDE